MTNFLDPYWTIVSISIPGMGMDAIRKNSIVQIFPMRDGAYLATLKHQEFITQQWYVYEQELHNYKRLGPLAEILYS